MDAPGCRPGPRVLSRTIEQRDAAIAAAWPLPGESARRGPHRGVLGRALGAGEPLEVRSLCRDDAVLAAFLRAPQRRLARLEQSLERERPWWYQAGNTSAQGHEAPRARGGMVHQQIAHALAHDLGVLRRFLCRLALCQHHEGAAVPAAHEVAATPIRGGDHARYAPDAGVARRAVEFLVIGTQVVDVEQRQADLVRFALRELPVPLQQLLEVSAGMQSREPVLAQPGRKSRGKPLGLLQPFAGVAMVANEMSELVRGAQRMDHGLVPEHRAVRAVVA